MKADERYVKEKEKSRKRNLTCHVLPNKHTCRVDFNSTAQWMANNLRLYRAAQLPDLPQYFLLFPIATAGVQKMQKCQLTVDQSICLHK